MLPYDKKALVYQAIQVIIERQFEYKNLAKLKKRDVLKICKKYKVTFNYVIACLEPLQEENVLDIVSSDIKQTRRDDIIAVFQILIPPKYWDRLDPEHGSIL